MESAAGRIAIVGTGLIGAGWGAFYASKGFAVSLHDADASARQAGYERTVGMLAALRDFGLVTSAEHDRAVAGIAVADDLAEAVADVRLVQESVTERYEVKKPLFRDLDRLAPPDAVLASSSSGLLMSELQDVMERPGRSLIAHPFNPPHLIPLVELVPGRRTDPQVLAETRDWFESLGKVAVVLGKEVPGHVANRLQAAVWREAIALVLDGVASVADVDRALAAGPGLRWALLGPHMLFHLGGGAGGIGHFIDHVGASWDKLWADMADWRSLPPETAGVLVPGVQDEAGGRTAQEIARWRDEKLVELLRVIHGR